MLIEHGILVCQKCDYRAEDRSLMRKHMETHTGTSLLPCRICEFETTKKATLDEHIEIKHNQKSGGSKDRDHHCEKCGKTYNGKVALTYHKCCSCEAIEI